MAILRLRPDGPQWPYSVAQFRADEPHLSISNNPHPAEFAACWGMVASAGGASPEALAALVAAAEGCNLPSEFVAALQSQEN